MLFRSWRRASPPGAGLRVEPKAPRGSSAPQVARPEQRLDVEVEGGANLSWPSPALPGTPDRGPAPRSSVSALEMSQNAMQTYRSFEDVDKQLQQIMKNIFKQLVSASEDYQVDDNFVIGANIAGFRRVVQVMQAQGYV